MVCDLAEYYHIYNYRELPVNYLATLVAGLRADSRTMQAISGTKFPLDITLLAAILDNVSILVWSKTKDAQKGRNKPKSVLEQLTTEKKPSKIVAFNSGADFDRAREAILDKHNNREEV